MVINLAGLPGACKAVGVSTGVPSAVKFRWASRTRTAQGLSGGIRGMAYFALPESALAQLYLYTDE